MAKRKKKQPARPEASIVRDRIKEFRRIRAGDLIVNPRNWRTHPENQRAAMAGVLAEIGYADALLARETPEGLVLVDGHLRAETTPDQEVPVLVLDVTAEEADKILVTLDPLAAMAEASPDRLEDLLRDVQTGDEALAAMLDDLAYDAGIVPGEEEAEPDAPAASPIDDKFAVIVDCRDEAHQKQLYEKLQTEGEKCRLLTL